MYRIETFIVVRLIRALLVSKLTQAKTCQNRYVTEFVKYAHSAMVTSGWSTTRFTDIPTASLWDEMERIGKVDFNNVELAAIQACLKIAKECGFPKARWITEYDYMLCRLITANNGV